MKPSKPIEAVLETCDCCGDTIGLSDATFTGRQVLCRRCNKPNTEREGAKMTNEEILKTKGLWKEEGK